MKTGVPAGFWENEVSRLQRRNDTLVRVVVQTLAEMQKWQETTRRGGWSTHLRDPIDARIAALQQTLLGMGYGTTPK